MSLFRQLWLAVITSAVLAFAGSFVLSLVTARNYLENQLAVKNSDNANSLAISITNSPKDAVTIEVLVSAQYDNGQYELIRLIDPQGKVMVERSLAKDTMLEPIKTNVPNWFRSIFSIQSRPGIAQISNGWNQFATIELVSQTNYAYQELWNGGLKLLVWFILGGIIAGFIGSFVLRGLRKPLDAVVGQAKAIQERRFEIIPVSTIPELRLVTESTNAMVKRLKAMFDEEAQRLEQVRREANLDQLTGLANRAYFLAHLESLLQDDGAPASGSVLIMRISNLAEINRNAGREATDELLKRSGNLLGDLSHNHKSSLAGRLNGADLALIIPNFTQCHDIAEQIIDELRAIAAALTISGENIACLGVTNYHHDEPLMAVISRIDQALAVAENKGYANWHEILSGEPMSNMGDWKQMIELAIKTRSLKLVWFPTENHQGDLLHYECPLRMKKPESETWMVAGSFMPMASRLQLTAKLDLATVELALTRLQENTDELAINISGESLIESFFLPQLIGLLKAQSETVRQRLWLEVPEVGVFEHFEEFSEFCRSLHTLKCRVGIEHFGHRFSNIGKLHNLGLDYIKVDGSFIRNIHQQVGNQAFLRGLCSIAHNIGITVIAENVQIIEELEAISELGFDGATGQALAARKQLA